jgi:hypothetical protein
MNATINHPTGGSTLPAGVKLGQSTVEQMSFPTYGDKTIAYQVKIPITYSSLNVSVYLDLIIAIKGRANVATTFQATTSPFPTDQEQHYTGLVVGRLTNT